MRKAVLILLLGSFLTGMTCRRADLSPVFISKDVYLVKMKEGVYRHVSFIQLQNGTSFPCNGLVYVHDKEALIFDTPVTAQGTKDLLRWLEEQELVPVGLVANHYHEDCTKGLDQFVSRGTEIYMNIRTQNLLKNQLKHIEVNAFDSLQQISLGEKTVLNRYFGPAHSQDNIVSYLKDEKVLFGGCQVKSMGASKGNLADANTDLWPTSIESIQVTFPNVVWVVPGHGDPGGVELLEYSRELFLNE